MNKLFVIALLSLFAHVGISFGMDYDLDTLDKAHTQLRAEIAVKQANKALFMACSASDYTNYFISLETIAIANLEAQCAQIDSAKAQIIAEQHAMIVQGQQNVADMRQLKADLQSVLNCSRVELQLMEALRSNNSESARLIAEQKIKIVDLESQIKNIDDILALFA